MEFFVVVVQLAVLSKVARGLQISVWIACSEFCTLLGRGREAKLAIATGEQPAEYVLPRRPILRELTLSCLQYSCMCLVTGSLMLTCMYRWIFTNISVLKVYSFCVQTAGLILPGVLGLWHWVCGLTALSFISILVRI